MNGHHTFVRMILIIASTLLVILIFFNVFRMRQRSVQAAIQAEKTRIAIEKGEITPAICTAIREDDLLSIQLLLAKDEMINVDCHSGSPLNMAIAKCKTPSFARWQWAKIVRLLLLHNANPNSPYDRTLSPLEQAVQFLPEVVPALLANKADVNVEFGEPLRLAIKAHQPDVVQALIEHGASVNPFAPPVEMYVYPDRRGTLTLRAKTDPDAPFTPLGNAYLYDPQCVPILLKAGAKLGTDQEHILPRAIVSHDEKASQQRITVLLANGATIDGVNNKGETALHRAVEAGKTATVKQLIDLRANVNIRDAAGHTPLDLAMRKHHSDIVTLLRKAGATQTL